MLADHFFTSDTANIRSHVELFSKELEKLGISDFIGAVLSNYDHFSVEPREH